MKTLRVSQTAINQLLNLIGDGIFVLDADGEVVYLNEVARSHMGDGVRGHVIWDLFPEPAAICREPVRKVFENGESSTVILEFPPRVAWSQIDVKPLDVGHHGRLAAVIYRDVTHKHIVEATTSGATNSDGDQSAKVTESDAQSPAEMARDRSRTSLIDATLGVAATDLDGRFLEVNDTFCKITGYLPHELLDRTLFEITHPDDVAQIVSQIEPLVAGTIPGITIEKRYVRSDNAIVWVRNRVSIARSDDGAPVQFVALAEDITDRKVAEHEANARATRESLLGRIADVMRQSIDPDAIQAEALPMLAEYLGVDRCYFAVYDLTRGVVTVGPDWRRRNLPSIQGVHPFRNTARMFEELYHGSRTSVIVNRDDSDLSAETIDNMKALQIRSRISVALASNDGMGTLTAAMSDEPRDWKPEEIEMLEKVALQLKSAIETVRVQQREHRIATELQTALLPDLPDFVPGLSVASHMQPALDEAAIGGDFCDVFPLDKGTYALVVGDVSGKGLAAAAQLATVRNGIRTTLYLDPSPGAAVNSLNAILTSHELLTGFVTAFIGIYDAATGRITYTSCGHEPALVRRGRNAGIEQLGSTGPPLGVTTNADYSECHVTLGEGDELLVYTDGLSESGPNRLEMLGTPGLVSLFDKLPNHEQVSESAAEFVRSVAAYSGMAFRDDVCVLLARRQ